MSGVCTPHPTTAVKKSNAAYRQGAHPNDTTYPRSNLCKQSENTKFQTYFQTYKRGDYSRDYKRCISTTASKGIAVGPQREFQTSNSEPYELRTRKAMAHGRHIAVLGAEAAAGQATIAPRSPSNRLRPAPGAAAAVNKVLDLTHVHP